MCDDQDLLLSNQQDSFAVLYDRYADRLYRYALMISSSTSIAEEATQETFIYMLEHRTSFDPSRSKSLLGWLYGVLRNQIRRLIRDDSGLVMNIAKPETAPAAEDVVALFGEAQDIFRAISRLKLKQREVIVLCGVHEVDYVTAAEILSVPVGTVRSRLYRARKNLMHELGTSSELVEEMFFV